MSYSELLDELETDHVRAVTITGQEVLARLENGSTVRSYVPDEAQFLKRLQDHDLEIRAEPSGDDGTKIAYEQ